MKLETHICVDSIEAVDQLSDEFVHIKYPFMDKLKMNVDDHAVDMPVDTRVEMCIYRIVHNLSSLPFLQFLLYLDGNEKDKGGVSLIFPYILSKHSKSGLVDQCTPALRALFGDLEQKVKYEGYMYRKKEKRCMLFFKELRDETKDMIIPFINSKDLWWWALSSEIYNDHKLLNFPVANSVISFFNNNLDIMRLQFEDKTIESPIALYSGKHLNYVSFMAEFGMKKSSTRAHFGPYYYSGEFMGTMRYACYAMGFESHVLSDGTSLTVNEHGKHTQGGIVRFAVFLGRCRAFFLNGEEDLSELSLYWANKDPLIKFKLALRDINGDWTRDFDSAYVGEYDFKIEDTIKKRVAGWTIKNYDNQIPLSCHEIDTKNVPDEYDPAFVDYKLI